jgi:hypothetical protein
VFEMEIEWAVQKAGKNKEGCEMKMKMKNEKYGYDY